MKAFSYLRVSGKDQIDGDGFARQRDKIEKWAKANGYTIAREFIEAGVSGTKDLEDRPALSALFAAVNGIRTVIVERADRLSRDLVTGEVILAKFREAGVAVIEAEDGRNLAVDDPDNPTGTLIRQILAAVAQFDKTGIVSKLRKARERKKSETGRCEGVKPYGTFPGEAEAVERMRRLRRKAVGSDKRMSFSKIADVLTEEGFPTRSGGRWAASTVKQILNR